MRITIYFRINKREKKERMNYLGLDEQKTTKVSEELNRLLSCYHVYYQNLRRFHWHVEGHNFFELHALFEVLYNDAKLKIDEIAERILTIRHRPLGRMSEYLHYSKVVEAEDVHGDEEMIETILDNHKEMITCMRATLKTAADASDEGTVDLVAGILAAMEKRSWMLEAWCSKKFEKALA